MAKRSITFGAPILVAVAAVLALVAWLYPVMPAGAKSLYPAFVRSYYPDTVKSIPVIDGDAQGKSIEFDQSELTANDIQPTTEFMSDWPWFRGENYDNVSRADVPLTRSFGDGPKVLWRVDLGEGYAGPAIRDGRVFLIDYDQEKNGDVLRCFNLADGAELWRRFYEIRIKRQHGMSRTVPAVTETVVVSLGPKCHVMTCRPDTGELLWGIDMVARYGTEIPQWYAGQCPVIEDGLVFLAPGGNPKGRDHILCVEPGTNNVAPYGELTEKHDPGDIHGVLMMAVDSETGEIKWVVPNPGRWEMTHASILPMTFAGRRMLVYPGTGGVVGVDAATGEVLWETTEWTVKIANVPTPVDLGEGRIFLSGGYSAGSMFLSLKDEGGKIVPVPGKRLKESEFGTEQQTPVYFNGYLYGVVPRKGTYNAQMVCFSAADGEWQWFSGPEDTFGLGPYMIADNMLIAVDDEGVLTLADTDPAQYKRFDRADVLPGHEAWGPLSITDGLLIVRDLTSMACVDLRAESYKE